MIGFLVVFPIVFMLVAVGIMRWRNPAYRGRHVRNDGVAIFGPVVPWSHPDADPMGDMARWADRYTPKRQLDWH